MSPSFVKLFTEQVALNSAAMLRPSEKGSKTEIAALKLIELAGVNYETIREAHEILHKFPFSSKRKRMSVIVDIP